MRVLLVDDEPAFARFMVRALHSMGLTVDQAPDGVVALRKVLYGTYDLILTDIRMPGLSGLEFLVAVRAADPDVPVIMLSAADDVETRVRALDAGAVDFVGKPFAIEELLARVRGALRKANVEDRKSLQVGPYTLDARRHEVTIGGRVIALSQREFLLLECLMKRAGDTCTREELLSDVWGYTFDPGSNIVDVYVRRLRSKISADIVQTVRSVGYRLSLGREAHARTDVV
ncbi:MAG: two-component system, OmpR family, response regulator [Frankiaceae bacterium]|nr:two-component system, OmpR family, response regulator [Frankiaceae bacterium]